MPVPGNLVTPPQVIMLGEDLSAWHERTDVLIAAGAGIIALRGAGTVNGIDPEAAHAAISAASWKVHDTIQDRGSVAFLYDGDADNRNRPDVGAVFGTVTSGYRGDPTFIPMAAQSESWYSPSLPDGRIASFTGDGYETYVFADSVPGTHASLTQSESLVAYPGYEQVFVGPASPIAFSQLEDLNNKAQRRSAEAGPVPVYVIGTPNNPEVAEELQEKLRAAEDPEAQAKITAKLAQREVQPYGALFTSEGAFAVDQSRFSKLAFTVIRFF